MDAEKLDKFLDEIIKSGIAKPLITKLSKEFDLDEVLVTSLLKSLIQLTNTFAAKI